MTPPGRLASGTVPPPVLERPLPSLLAVAARFRSGQAPPHDDDVEVIHVDLGDDDVMFLDDDDVEAID